MVPKNPKGQVTNEYLMIAVVGMIVVVGVYFYVSQTAEDVGELGTEKLEEFRDLTQPASEPVDEGIITQTYDPVPYLGSDNSGFLTDEPLDENYVGWWVRISGECYQIIRVETHTSVDGDSYILMVNGLVEGADVGTEFEVYGTFDECMGEGWEEYTCLDSDGDDPYTMGYVGLNTGSGGEVLEDYCRISTYNNEMVEYICSDGELESKEYLCDGICWDGHCAVIDGVSCMDSDGGNQPNIKGYVEIMDADGMVFRYSDECSGGLYPGEENVAEFFCVGNSVDGEPVLCPNGCEDGVCKIGPPTCENIVYHPEVNPNEPTKEDRIVLCLQLGLKWAGVIKENNEYQWYGNCRSDPDSGGWTVPPRYQFDLEACGQVLPDTCKDTDGGIDYFVAGSTGLDPANRQYYDHDYCQSGGDPNNPSRAYYTTQCIGASCYLIEMYCKNGLNEMEAYSCSGGCEKGRCKMDVEISANPTSGQAPLTVAFTGSVIDGTSPYTYLWDFGDSGTSTMLQTPHVYITGGTYTAILSVKDAKGECGNDSIQIVVAGLECTSDADCLDADPQTNDVCVNGVCYHSGVCTSNTECNDANPYTGDFCRDGICQNTECQQLLDLIGCGWPVSSGDPRFDPRVDLDGNGNIGLGDYMILMVSECGTLMNPPFHKGCTVCIDGVPRCTRKIGEGVDECLVEMDPCCGDGLINFKIGEECEETDPSGSLCAWGRCNQITCECCPLPIVLNPGFEDGTQGWVGIDGLDVAVETGIGAHSGEKYLDIYTAGSYGGTFTVYQDIENIVAGCIYSAEGWISSNDIYSASIDVVWLNSAGTAISTTSVGVKIGTEDWTRKSRYSMTAPAGAVKARLRLRTVIGNAWTWARFDDLRFWN
ncbi:MAG: PKD domain-containing protein [Candidatus Altiarchaeota archaeon]|nr:PKD domain-containing protein [Candidatus Altiarchaeota archaeon]